MIPSKNTLTSFMQGQLFSVVFLKRNPKKPWLTLTIGV